MASEDTALLNAARRLKRPHGAACSDDRALAENATRLQMARRLVRELEVLEGSLLAAERAALDCPRRPLEHRAEHKFDIACRLAEMERHELSLQHRERALERQRMFLEQSLQRLQRGKDSLKRAIARFRSFLVCRGNELEARDRRMSALQADLLRARREFAREQIRLKTLVRGSLQSPLPKTP